MGSFGCYLATRSLRDGDNIADLQDRLSLFPSDLEKLFSKILERLNPLYFAKLAGSFNFSGERGSHCRCYLYHSLKKVSKKPCPLKLSQCLKSKSCFERRR